MPVCKETIRERLQQAKELKQTANDAFRSSVVNMSNSLVLLAHQVEEMASILKDLNYRVLALEDKLDKTREQVWFKPPYIEK